MCSTPLKSGGAVHSVNDSDIPKGRGASPRQRAVMFKIEGPFRVRGTPLVGGEYIDREDGARFWRQKGLARLAQRYGCYVFAMGAGPGVMPFYVGRTVKSFQQECFQPSKLNHYNKALRCVKKGRSVLFFVVAPRKKGQRNKRVVSSLERYLIQQAKARNHRLLNKQAVKLPKWGIQGVLRGTPGKPPKAAALFKKLLGL